MKKVMIMLSIRRGEELLSALNGVMIEAFLGLPSAPCPASTPKANAGRGEANGVPEAIRIQLRQQLRTAALEVRQRYGFGWDWA